MMRQYRDLKRKYPEYILFFRLGDFYEMFFSDAEIASKTLEIALTTRSKGEGERVPMAGVPYHAAEGYIGRLLKAGYKVAVCEQMEAPGRGKMLVRREVVRLVTPSSTLDQTLLDRSANNFLLCLVRGPGGLGAALLDLTTAEFLAGEERGFGEDLLRTALGHGPAELLIPDGLKSDSVFMAAIRSATEAPLTVREEGFFQLGRLTAFLQEHFGVPSLDGFGLSGSPLAIQAAGAALRYLSETQATPLTHISRITLLTPGTRMLLDETTGRTLELTETLQDRGHRGSLYWALDRTRTPMGGRLLRQWLLAPLLDPTQIDNRLDAVQELVDSGFLRQELRELLKDVGDLERLTSRITLKAANARDLVALKLSLQPLPTVRDLTKPLRAPLLQEILKGLDDCADLATLIRDAIEEEPPLTLHEGGLIKEGWSQELRDLRRQIREAKEWIAGLEGRERERTGITSLKVRFNRVFGYSIEVSKPNLRLVPPDYVRRQTLVGGERFITPELKEYESLVLGAEERTCTLEHQLFEEVRRRVADEAGRLLDTARALAQLDALVGLAECAHERGYARPQVNPGPVIEILDGRHPVLEILRPGEPFVPNDVRLDEETQVVILTGPNMAGKSTFMRQVALIVLLGQIGSFVPARSARIGVVDRIFTRVGASDNLGRGQSTFLVEMNETSNLLHNATARSLILLDEIGRGTSTFDGLAIAWAVTEYIHDRKPGARTLFATHYHELTELARELTRVRNFHVSVREWSDEIIFLHKVRPGGSSRSYGIQVARLAGLPREVIDRAKGILADLERGKDLALPHRTAGSGLDQLNLFAQPDHPVLEEIRRLDLGHMTPIEALNRLHQLQGKLQGS